MLATVRQQRKALPRLGACKLHYVLKKELFSTGAKCRRDKLFGFLGAAEMLIMLQRRYVQTTNSRHWLRRYPNISKGLVLNAPEQL